MIRELLFSRRAIPTWIALAALFVALGGPAAAVDLVSGRKIPGKRIKAETITARQVKDGTLTEVELSPATVAALRALAPDSVNGASVADGSLGSADLGDGAVGSSELGGDVVEAAKVHNGSLGGADIGRFTGTLNISFGSIGAGACASSSSTSLTPVAPDQSLTDDAIVVTPPSNFPSTATVVAQAAGAAQISVSVCNHGAGALNLGSQNFRYVTIDTAGQ